MVSIKYNKELGNYKVTNDGKEYRHATLKSAKEQVAAILRVERKRNARKNK